MKKIFIFFFLLSCSSTESNLSQNITKFDFNKNLTFNDFKKMIIQYSKEAPYPNIDD